MKVLDHKKFAITYDPFVSNEMITKKYGDHDVIVTRSVRKIDRDLLDRTSFGIVATCTKGTDHIDVEHAAKKKIVVLNADDSNNISAAEHAMALLLASFKNLIHSDRLVRENKFSSYDYRRNELYGKKIGVIGFGKVGSYFGRLCRAFGMEVYANDVDRNVVLKNKKFDFKSLNFIIKNCDALSIHIPLNRKNRNFFSKEKLRLLQKDCVLINTSRGDIMDERYLLRMLQKRDIRFAGLDVFKGEPGVDKAFAKLDNVVLSNHIAGKTIESKRRVSENVFRQIEKYYN